MNSGRFQRTHDLVRSTLRIGWLGRPVLLRQHHPHRCVNGFSSFRAWIGFLNVRCDSVITISAWRESGDPKVIIPFTTLLLMTSLPFFCKFTVWQVSRVQFFIIRIVARGTNTALNAGLGNSPGTRQRGTSSGQPSLMLR